MIHSDKKVLSTTPPYLTTQTKKIENRASGVKASLVAGHATPLAKRAPAKKRRPRPVDTGVAKGKAKSGKQPMVAAAPAEPAKLMLRPLAMGDDTFIQTVTQEEIAPIFKTTYGYDLDMSMVLSYVHAANTRMILVDDQVAGYVSYVADDSGRLNIGSLILAAEYQGKGYGKRIMRQIEQEARAMGIMELEVFIQESNARSQAFAESLGFTRVQSMQPQTIVMVKTLVPAQPEMMPQPMPGQVMPGQAPVM
ncbi:MAG: GNAT family N-acetyltransferase [Firmicutes bacterium]|nr:GNAT family N-acetyltransferase [Bacillota bacterium]